MRRRFWAAATVGMVLAAVGVGARTGVGQDNRPGEENGRDHGCSAATLRGAYGLQFQGTRPVRPPFPAGTETYMGIALRTYDGAGQFTQLSNVKGSVIGIEADVESTGTYEVNEDCTGSHTAQFTEGGPVITDRFVITGNGREVRLAVMTPLAIMNAGVLQKVRAR
jgi:hypothetical protein